MKLYTKIPSREVRHLWQFNAKLAEECRVLRLKVAERTQERDELISNIFKMQSLINRCYNHMDSMSNIAIGVDTLYKRRKTGDEDDSGDDGDGVEDGEYSTTDEGNSCNGVRSDVSSD